MADDPAPLLRGAGQEPGTSTKVTSGTLNASQVRTNRAAFTEASMSSTPASELGWFPTIPTACPPSRANPQTMFCAYSACSSRKSAVVDDGPDHPLDVVGLVWRVRHSVSSSGASRSTGSAGAA